jgi:predicted cupin superfamily sugar epimerase
MNFTAQAYIEALQLLPHPEGGFYKETYRSDCTVQPQPATSLSSSQLAPVRAASTGIYFLLEHGNFSAFHRIASDEMWHFYAGDALEVLELLETGELVTTLLGMTLAKGETFQHVVKANTWFASRVVEGGAFALVGCTVAPGFDFSDFQLADRVELSRQYPIHREVIATLTR